MRKVPLVKNEYFHVYNRGVDKRTIFEDKSDVTRFFQSMIICNGKNKSGVDTKEILRQWNTKYETVTPTSDVGVRGLREICGGEEPFVAILAYNLLPNHFHLLLTPVVENGISLFMQRLQNSYTKYFNAKQARGGALFQGAFKSTHMKNDSMLLYYFAYVTFNHSEIHRRKGGYVSEGYSSEKDVRRKKSVFCSADLLNDLGLFAHSTQKLTKIAREIRRKRDFAKGQDEKSVRDIISNITPTSDVGVGV